MKTLSLLLVASFVIAGCASTPRPAVLDTAELAIASAESTELPTTQPRLLEDARHHMTQAELAHIRGDSEAAELHGHMALQRVRTADHLDVAVLRDAMLRASGSDAPSTLELRASAEATTREKGSGTTKPAPEDAPPGSDPTAAAPPRGLTPAVVDAAIHSAEDARSVLIQLKRADDPRLAEGDDQLDLARRARDSGHPERAYDKAREALIIYTVIRMTPPAEPPRKR